ncbi:unnamed protein product [Effrenium voratum]|nr:unnamed protein product [Effrenium voratum]
MHAPPLGTIRFIGQTDFAPGEWIGVELFEPKGKNDGSVKGHRYFSCKDKHGLFCKASFLREAEPKEPPKPTAEEVPEDDAQAAGTAGAAEAAEAGDVKQDAGGRKSHASPFARRAAGADPWASDSSCGGSIIVAEESEANDSGSSEDSADEKPDESTAHAGAEAEGDEGDSADKERESWHAKVQDLAQRGLQLGHLLGFYQSLAEGSLVGDQGQRLMTHFDPDQHTTHDVVRSAIIPATKSTPFGSCAYSTAAGGNAACLATVMVSHHWRNLFCHLVAAVVAFALGETSYEATAKCLVEKDFESLRQRLDRRDALRSTFWLCLFCVNQHASICNGLPGAPLPREGQREEEHREALEYHHRETHDPVTQQHFELCGCATTKHWNNSSLCEMDDKFDAMMAALDKEVPKAVQRKLNHVIVVDRSFEVFSRIWVMAEIAKAQELELTQVAMLFPPPEKLKANPTGKRRTQVPASAALEVARVRETLDVRNCKASRREDVDAILASIPDVDAFNDKLKEVLFNERSGILETWSAERCAGFFDVIDPLKDLVSVEQLSAPQVIMLGQESTGKSTLLERLTGLPIFPRNADLCTRALIKVRLRRGEQRKLRLLVQDMQTQRDEDPQGAQPGQGLELELEGLGAAVMKEMTRQVRLEALRLEVPGKDEAYYAANVKATPLEPSDGLCTKKLLVVELVSPKAPNLDVVDCPGLVAASARGRPADVAASTAGLVRSYAKKHREGGLFVVAVKDGSLGALFCRHVSQRLREELQKAWSEQGLFGHLAAELEKELMACVPEELPLTRATPGGFHLAAALRGGLAPAAARLAGFAEKAKAGLWQRLELKASEQRLDRLRSAEEALQAALWAELQEELVSEASLELSPWVRLEEKSVFTFTARLEKAQLVQRLSLQFHRFLEEQLGRLPELAEKLQEKLPPEVFVEDCSEQRFQLLSQLQKLRLVQARLRESFGEELPEAKASASAAPEAKASAARAEHTAESETRFRRTEEEVKGVVESWKEFLHERAFGFFPSVEELEAVLASLARNTDAGTDPLEGEDHVLWRGESSESEAFLYITPESSSPTYVNRLLAALFVEDEAFARLSTLPKEPFRMSCGNQLCVSLTHITLPE